MRARVSCAVLALSDAARAQFVCRALSLSRSLTHITFTLPLLIRVSRLATRTLSYSARHLRQQKCKSESQAWTDQPSTVHSINLSSSVLLPLPSSFVCRKKDKEKGNKGKQGEKKERLYFQHQKQDGLCRMHAINNALGYSALSILYVYFILKKEYENEGEEGKGREGKEWGKRLCILNLTHMYA
jgi:hypothetical protein